MKICVIGTGYVGLVSGSCFSDLGNTVWCVDKDKNKIEMLNNNEVPIFEPGLKELVQKNYHSGRIKFTTNLKLAVQNSDLDMCFRRVDDDATNGGVRSLDAANRR